MTEVKQSPIHGYGVFATQDILSGSEILSSIFIEVTDSSTKAIKDYYFSIPGKQVLPLDRAAIVNHSDRPNSKWMLKEDQIVFIAISDIKAGEEIFHNYGFCRFKKG